MSENDKIRKIFTDHHCDVFTQKADDPAVINSFCTSKDYWPCSDFKDASFHEEHGKAFAILGQRFQNNGSQTKKAFCIGLSEFLEHDLKVSDASFVLESLAELDLNKKDYNLAIQTYLVLLASENPDYPDLENRSQLAKALFEKATRQPKLDKEEKNALLYEAERLNWKIVEECNKKLEQNGFYEYLKSRANSYVDLMKIEDARSPRKRDKIDHHFTRAMEDFDRGISTVKDDKWKATFSYAKAKFLEEATEIYLGRAPSKKVDIGNYKKLIPELYQTAYKEKYYKENSHFLFSYAEAELVQGNYEHAKELFVDALEPAWKNQKLDPKKRISAHLGLARAYAASNQSQKAVEENRLAKVEAFRFLRTNPNDKAVQFLLDRARGF